MILSISVASADVERMFSRAGNTVTESRSSLTQVHVNDELVTLYCWLLESEGRLHNLEDPSAPSYAVRKAAEYYKLFVTIGIDLELHDPVQLVEDSDDGVEDEDEDDEEHE